MSNIKALYINLPDICECKRKCTVTMPLLADITFYKYVHKNRRDQRIFANVQSCVLPIVLKYTVLQLQLCVKRGA